MELTEIGKILGLAGVIVLVVYKLYDRITRLPIFANVGPVGTFIIVVLMMVLVFILAVIIVSPEAIAIFGNGNQVIGTITNK